MNATMNKPEKTLMVMAGGTGGHVYPAMAVADHLKRVGWNIVWLCTEGGMENRLIENKGYKKAMITMRGVRGKGLLGWLLLPVKLVKAFSQSVSALRQHQPSVVLGMGGYVSFPGGMMAALRGIPLVLHEQNTIAGLANRVLGIVADRVLTGFPQVMRKGDWVGNPVRTELAALPAPTFRYGERDGPLRILVIGGSLGAQALYENLPRALALIPESERPEVMHQSGARHLQALQALYLSLGVKAHTVAFITDMTAAYGWADLVICRAGALTVAELAVCGIASILVPFPSAVDDHQTSNARFLANAGAAILLPQNQLSPERLSDLKTLTRGQLTQMAEKARDLARPEATVAVAKICEELAR